MTIDHATSYPVVLTEVDRLSKQAQAGLRRTMERYSAQCRLVLVCNSLTKVIEPIRSRCMGVRVSAPSVADLSTLLIQVCTWLCCMGIHILVRISVLLT